MTEHAQQAADLLGSDHPVPRLAETIHAVRRQALVCVVVHLGAGRAVMAAPHAIPTAHRQLPCLSTCSCWAHGRATARTHDTDTPTHRHIRPRPATDRRTERDAAIARHALAPTTGAATATHPQLRRTLERTAPGPAATAGRSRTRAIFRAGTTGGSVAGGGSSFRSRGSDGRTTDRQRLPITALRRQPRTATTRTRTDHLRARQERRA